VCPYLQGKLEHITVNNFPIGRNVDEALRMLQVGSRAGTRPPGVASACVTHPSSQTRSCLACCLGWTVLVLDLSALSMCRSSALQAVQYVAEHGEVCPAGWKPGEKTMVADPEKSLDYFESVGGEVRRAVSMVLFLPSRPVCGAEFGRRPVRRRCWLAKTGSKLLRSSLRLVPESGACLIVIAGGRGGGQQADQGQQQEGL
jgi:hypothetical protein